MKILRFFIAFTLVCFALSQSVQGVVPPPAGGYPNFTTAAGDHALQALTLGLGNTAIGTFSLFSVTTGSFNTAVGAGALDLNTADENIATGAGALLSNTTGSGNTANGAFALFNSTGFSNTAIGDRALLSNSTGSNDTANGAGALISNTTGNANTANGASALISNTTGNNNTAAGFAALFSNATGIDNTAVGVQALYSNTAHNNIGLGYLAGLNLTTGNCNIDIGNNGMAGDAGIIRIGTETVEGCGQSATFIAGIFGAPIVGGVPVVVNSYGQLGISAALGASSPSAPSSRRFKREFLRYEAMNTKLRSDFLKEHRKVEEQQATITELKREMNAVVAQLKEQASQIQKVSAQIEVSKAAPQTVKNND